MSVMNCREETEAATKVFTQLTGWARMLWFSAVLTANWVVPTTSTRKLSFSKPWTSEGCHQLRKGDQFRYIKCIDRHFHLKNVLLYNVLGNHELIFILIHDRSSRQCDIISYKLHWHHIGIAIIAWFITLAMLQQGRHLAANLTT